MTSNNHRVLGDLLFYLQMFFAMSMGVSQAWKMLQSTEGIIFTWFAFWGLFLAINLSLSYKAHLLQPSRITKQTVIVYATWTVLMAANIIVFLWKDIDIWTPVDTLTSTIAGAGIGLTLGIGKLNKLPLLDPIIRGWIAVMFKAVPQLTLAYSIWIEGGDGLAPVAVVVGHITICTRIGQILLSLREAGWDRNRIGSAISEISNEASMIILTIVWLMR
ncbi:MAG: hypothetical protein ACU84Q_14170 [Gammaproteobacteria bacterium]